MSIPKQVQHLFCRLFFHYSRYRRPITTLISISLSTESDMGAPTCERPLTSRVNTTPLNQRTFVLVIRIVLCTRVTFSCGLPRVQSFLWVFIFVSEVSRSFGLQRACKKSKQRCNGIISSARINHSHLLICQDSKYKLQF